MITAHVIHRMVRTGVPARGEAGIVIDPWDTKNLNPNSYDLTLSPTLMTYDDDQLDVRIEPKPEIKDIPVEGVVLRPGELYLGCSNEYTESHRLVPMINGKSSLARLGISVHQTGGFGDIGFCGNWTLEITVTKPVRIFADMRFAQLCWFVPVGRIEQTYAGKYQGSKTRCPVPSMAAKDWAGGADCE